jgi:hypothetical protein
MRDFEIAREDVCVFGAPLLEYINLPSCLLSSTSSHYTSLLSLKSIRDGPYMSPPFPVPKTLPQKFNVLECSAHSKAFESPSMCKGAAVVVYRHNRPLFSSSSHYTLLNGPRNRATNII